jgi:UDP-N-acetylmuramoylalanine--D-glutamate ligase
MNEIKSKNILVLGLGKSGKSATNFLQSKGANLFAFDDFVSNSDPEIKQLTTQGLSIISQESLPKVSPSFAVISPGFAVNHSIVQELKRNQIEIIGEMELAFRFLTNKVWGVTGTNGKTTVISLITHILNDNGKNAISCGNIGLPLIELAKNPKKDSILVVEISSYQLETLTSKKLSSAALLNITPDHLDRYPTMEDYAFAKAHIADLLAPGGKLYVEGKTYRKFRPLFLEKNVYSYGEDESAIMRIVKGRIIRFGQDEEKLPKFPIGSGKHDENNFLAAYALLREMGLSATQIVRSFQTFKKPPHRIEFVREINGIRFFDDSKGTNIDAVCKAVSSLKGNILLIAGGVDKGFPYIPWISHFQGRVVKIFAIGQAAEKIKGDISSEISVEVLDTLESAVLGAYQQAKPGENVLLSPGCASYDMFRDFAHRGDEFQKIVNNLKE